MEANALKVIGKNEWVAKLDGSFVATLGKYRKYDDSVQDLMRVIRNKKHHYSELPLHVQRLVGSLPAGYLGYFTSRYPNLITHIYYFVANDSNLVKEPIFQAYFQDEY
jgi:serine/threonine-protein kinase/endoribonuclease IRE1